MQRKGKKTPADYPQLCFRLPNEDERNRVDSLIEQIRIIYNERRTDQELLFRRNDVVLEALEIGLKAIKKKLER